MGDETHTFIASTSLLNYTSITHTVVNKKRLRGWGDKKAISKIKENKPHLPHLCSYRKSALVFQLRPNSF